jgi:hypothetical protein
MSHYLNHKSTQPLHVYNACEVLGVPPNFTSVELDEIKDSRGTTYQLSVWDVARNHKCGFLKLRDGGDMRCGSGSEMWDRLGELFELIPPDSLGNGKVRSSNCEMIEKAVKLLTPKGQDYVEVHLEPIHTGVNSHYQLSLMGKPGIPNKRVIVEFSGGIDELREGLENSRVVG